MKETMNTYEFNKSVKSAWEPNWLANCIDNAPTIREKMLSGRWKDFGDLPRPIENTPAIIAGNGPSMDKFSPIVHKWQGGALFSTCSLVHLWDACHRHPDYIVALDTSYDVRKKLSGVEFHRTTLLAHPSVDPEALKNWEWACGMFKMFEPEDTVLPKLYEILYPWITFRVMNSGCMANEAILLANALGFNPIFTVGVDFGFPRGQVNAMNVWQKAKMHYRPSDVEEIDLKDPAYFKAENGVYTTRTNLFYKQTFLTNWKITKANIVDCSDGIITEVPKADIKDVVEKQGKGFEEFYRTPDEIDKVVDDYLIPRGVYIDVSEAGRVRGIEIADSFADAVSEAEGRLGHIKERSDKWTKKGDRWERKP